MEEQQLLCCQLTKDSKIAAYEAHWGSFGRNNVWSDSFRWGCNRTLLYKRLMLFCCRIKELISITATLVHITSINLLSHRDKKVFCFSNYVPYLPSMSEGLPGTRASRASCRWTRRGPAWSSWRTASWPCSSPCRRCPGYWLTLCTAAAGGPGCRRAPGGRRNNTVSIRTATFFFFYC